MSRIVAARHCAFAGTSRRTSGPNVSACTTMEKITIAYVAASTMGFCGKSGIANTSAIEIPPRTAPQVRMGIVPFTNCTRMPSAVSQIG
jgi:hypothetical protein